MGKTLQNGVYLPNEGERNCYAGLKTNWEILDQKVADVTALQQAVAGALHREIVASLPTTDIDPNTIYMILSGTSATENVYDEYMYVNNAWELIGTSATDLTNYYTKGDVDGLLLLKANASDLTSHTGDTTIHVTASDKSKWNTVALIKQLRLVNAQVGSSTTIAFANIDDTNGIKVGDKCMDLDAKMFEITAVDTTNQTVTVGSALIDLAQDSAVVHTSGNETVSGQKTFGNGTLTVNNAVGSNIHGEIKLNGSRPGYIVADNSDDGVFDNAGCGISILLQDEGKPLHIGGYKVASNGRVFVDNTNKKPVLFITSGLIKTATLVPENDTVNPMFRILSQLDYANGNPSKTLDVRFIQYDNANATSAIYSNVDNKTSLGASSRKWSDVLTYKVNSVEPSSLSLPSGNSSDFIDISSYFSNTGTGDTNSYTASANGWVYLRLGDISSCQATVYDANNNRMWGQSSTGSVEQMTIPILKGQTLSTQWNTSSTVNVANARFIPCQGNI